MRPGCANITFGRIIAKWALRPHLEATTHFRVDGGNTSWLVTLRRHEDGAFFVDDDGVHLRLDVGVA
jgi:hypothetical protein